LLWRHRPRLSDSLGKSTAGESELRVSDNTVCVRTMRIRRLRDMYARVVLRAPRHSPTCAPCDGVTREVARQLAPSCHTVTTAVDWTSSSHSSSLATLLPLDDNRDIYSRAWLRKCKKQRTQKFKKKISNIHLNQKRIALAI